jgi:hypothetical protein
VSEFPTSDADIRALRIKILRALSAVDYPAQAIGSVAGRHQLTVEDVKSMVAAYGWPDPKEMRRYAFELEVGNIPGRSVPPAARPPVPQPAPQQPSAQALALERLLNAAERSPRARTKKLAARIRANLNDLRELVIDERKASEAAAAKAAEQARLKAEVADLEAQLAKKKAELKPGAGPKSRESTTPEGNAKAIRAWASKHSVDCPERGRVPRDVVEAYQLATAGAA